MPITHRSRFRNHNFPVTFTNYTRCFAQVVITTDHRYLTQFEAGVGATSGSIATTMERNKEVQTFIIGNVDGRSPDGIADRKIIDNKRCRLSIYLISPQHYCTHRNDLSEWSLVCSNVSLNASKYDYNILRKHEKLCIPKPTPWIP
jgi:hypothetical protein